MSRTTKKYRPKKFDKQLYERAQQQATIETAASVLALFLEHWSKVELEKLVAQQQFVCVDVRRNIYKVGRYDLHKIADTAWSVRNFGGKVIHEFCNKQAAVFFCLYDSRNHLQKSRELLNQDLEFGKAKAEVDFYSEQLHQAMQKKDGFKQDLYLARLSWVRPRMELCETNLQKTITAAKYSKVWETNNHETTRTRN